MLVTSPTPFSLSWIIWLGHTADSFVSSQLYFLTEWIIENVKQPKSLINWGKWAFWILLLSVLIINIQ